MIKACRGHACRLERAASAWSAMSLSGCGFREGVPDLDTIMRKQKKAT